MKKKILVVDNHFYILKSIKELLNLEGFEVDTLIDPLKFESHISEITYDCLLLDIKMPGMSGLELLRIAQEKFVYTPVIMISGNSSIQTAVDSIKMGAFDFIEKPIDPDRLLITLKHALQKKELIEEKEYLSKEIENRFKMIGKNAALMKVLSDVKTVAPTNAKVLIEGESGTGKELIAQALHFNSTRIGKSYIKMNCAAIPTDLLESELFGYVKGAFTGAVTDYNGKYLQADQGTLFLDEIGDLNLHVQAKILRALEMNEVQRLGEAKSHSVNVRIIAATNKDLNKMVEEGRFREDLFHRLNVVRIHIPPLRFRREDILPLAYHFLALFAEELNRPVVSICQQAEIYLKNYDWPGNVRELKNMIHNLVIFSKGHELGIQEVYDVFRNNKKTMSDDINNQPFGQLTDLKSALDDFESRYIRQVLERVDWKMQEASTILQIDRSSLFKKRKKFSIEH